MPFKRYRDQWYSCLPMRDDTIAAIATAPGEGAIAVIRISGSMAFEIAEKIFSRSIQNFKSHTAHYGQILNADQTPLDSVLLLLMKGPHSYTGEDTIEISCHGGTLISRKVLQRVLDEGVRPANPGEFSFRAFLNGKIDLAQAEAVQELIHAKNDLALKAAEKQLEGALSKKILAMKQELTEIAAILEAWIDFPEEGLEFASSDEILASLEKALHQMRQLKNTFHDGKHLHVGYSLCLLGSPNVGKSSLMNALLGKERAIVTDIAGTTRDLLEEDFRLGALHFKLIDTAGIRETKEIVEKEGIKRSQKAMKEADLILLLLDATRPLSKSDQDLIDQSPKNKTLLLWNKTDLAEPQAKIDALKISAKNHLGLEELKTSIHNLLWKSKPASKEEIILSNIRHFEALHEAIQFCEKVKEELKSNISAEFVTADMKAALKALSKIIGTDVTEDILTSIFSKFCLGK